MNFTNSEGLRRRLRLAPRKDVRDKIVFSDDWQTNEICKRQCEIEDLEDEIGIDLITLFKALKNGVYLKDKNGNCRYAKVTLISQVEDRFSYSQEEMKILGFCLMEQEYGEDCFFKDYDKTWSLTKEELENDKEN